MAVKQRLDTPTNNFATLNPLGEGLTGTLTEGNLKYVMGNAHNSLRGNFYVSSGKWYWEVYVVSVTYSLVIGLSSIDEIIGTAFNPAKSIGFYSFDGKIYYNSTSADYDSSYGSTDIIGVFLNLDDNPPQLSFYKNGSVLNSGTTIDLSNATYNLGALKFTPRFDDGSGTAGGATFYVNHGQDPTFNGNKTPSGGSNSDNSYPDKSATGIGGFFYEPPAGALALCTANLPEFTPTVANDNPKNFFKCVAYQTADADGVGGTVTVDIGFDADLHWIKCRNAGEEHYLIDTLRNTGAINGTYDKYLNSNDTDAEQAKSASGAHNATLTRISNGYNLTTADEDDGELYYQSREYVAWNWKAGGPTPSKTYNVKSITGAYQFFGDVSNSGSLSSNPALSLQKGGTYTFDQSDSSNVGHPLRFYTANNGTEYSSGQTTNGITVTVVGSNGSAGAYTKISIASDASVSSVYYQCSQHPAMGNTVTLTTTHGQTEFGGSIIPIVSANKEAGFSIAKYTGTNVSSTMGHGLSKAPEMIIVKNLSESDSWAVYHKSVASDAETDYLVLNTSAASVDATVWNDTAPTNQVFSIGTGGSISEPSENFIAYCWHSVPGYSAIGGYTGGSSVFIYTGFRPAWIMIKCINTPTSNSEYYAWGIYDSTRTEFNGTTNALYADKSKKEGQRAGSTGTFSDDGLDILSNGFRILSANYGELNVGSSYQYLYMAFAEQDGKYSNAR